MPLWSPIVQHAVFTLYIVEDSQDESIDPSEETLFSSVSIVDLAGAERTKRTQHTIHSARGQEAVKINQSLLVLGRCLETLRFNQSQPSTRTHHVLPYRDSLLTRLFRLPLSGAQHGHVVMMCNASRLKADYDETVRAVKYASMAREIRIQARVDTVRRHQPRSRLPQALPAPVESEDEADSDAEIDGYLDEIFNLKQTIVQLETRLVETENAVRKEVDDDVQLQIAQLENMHHERVDAVQKENDERWSRKLARLQTELDEARLQSTELQSLRVQQSHASSSEQEMQLQLDSHLHAVQTLQSEKAQLHAELIDAKQQLSSTQQKLQKTEKDLMHFQTKADKQLATLQKQMDKQLAQQASHVERLTDELKLAHDISTQLQATSDASVATVSTQRDEAVRVGDELRREMADSASNYLNQISQLNDKVTSLSQSLASANTSLQALQQIKSLYESTRKLPQSDMATFLSLIQSSLDSTTTTIANHTPHTLSHPKKRKAAASSPQDEPHSKRSSITQSPQASAIPSTSDLLIRQSVHPSTTAAAPVQRQTRRAAAALSLPAQDDEEPVDFNYIESELDKHTDLLGLHPAETSTNTIYNYTTRASDANAMAFTYHVAKDAPLPLGSPQRESESAEGRQFARLHQGTLQATMEYGTLNAKYASLAQPILTEEMQAILSAKKRERKQDKPKAKTKKNKKKAAPLQDPFTTQETPDRSMPPPAAVSKKSSDKASEQHMPTAGSVAARAAMFGGIKAGSTKSRDGESRLSAGRAPLSPVTNTQHQMHRRVPSSHAQSLDKSVPASASPNTRWQKLLSPVPGIGITPTPMSVSSNQYRRRSSDQQPMIKYGKKHELKWWQQQDEERRRLSQSADKQQLLSAVKSNENQEESEESSAAEDEADQDSSFHASADRKGSKPSKQQTDMKAAGPTPVARRTRHARA